MKEKTEADKFTIAVNNIIEESEFENYGEMMLRRYNQAEAERIAKEIDKEIMDLGNVFVNIKVKKVDLPDDLVRFVNNGVEVVEELKKCREELKKCRKEMDYLRYRTEKLEGDLEYAKCSGWLDRWIYPVEQIYPDYPIITYSNDDTNPGIVILLSKQTVFINRSQTNN